MNVYEAGLILRTAYEDYRPRKVFALFSGGHDSLTAVHVAHRFLPIDAVVHVATGTGIPETSHFVRETCEAHGWPLIVCRPPLDEQTGEVGAEYRAMVLAHGFPGPGEIPHRIAYIRLKDKALAPLTARSKRRGTDRIMLISGVRRQESVRRMGTAQAIARTGARVWVAPLINWTADDCGAYIERHGLRRNLVKDLLHISGECLCGCFAKPGEREEIARWFPLVDARIRALEAAAERSGVPARWGKRPGKWWLLRRKGQMELPLCSSCAKGGPDEDGGGWRREGV